MQFSPVSHYFLPLMSKYVTHHSVVIESSQSATIHYTWPMFTTIQNDGQNCSFSVLIFNFQCSKWVMMSILFQWRIMALIFAPLGFAGRRIISGTLQSNVYEGRNPNAVLFNPFSFQESVFSLLYPMYFQYKFNLFIVLFPKADVIGNTER